MDKKKLFNLIYMRTRPAFFIFSIIVLYGVLIENLSFTLILIGLSFFFIQMFGDLYNDYRDYEADIRNFRSDKLTISKILNKEQIRNLSLLFLFSGLISLFFFTIDHIAIFLVGISYSTVLWAYSFPKIHLKKHNINGYVVLASVWLIMPFALNGIFYDTVFLKTVLFAFFCFFQLMYIGCQKDSTDLKDDTNLFLARGWKQSSVISLSFGCLASLCLLALSFFNMLFFFIYGITTISKTINLSKIWKQKISRALRSKLIGAEFLTYNFFAIIGVFLYW